ncbi:Uncharacterised protein [Vibrio cholerae]|nr:Uncharacterised protein [Vibrio cholerae]CSA82810.1 Uncharacterised protein [Vibrio cholerae]CSB53042.1 Uncharacterised protein [Vibrio cholerae]
MFDLLIGKREDLDVVAHRCKSLSHRAHGHTRWRVHAVNGAILQRTSTAAVTQISQIKGIRVNANPFHDLPTRKFRA